MILSVFFIRTIDIFVDQVSKEKNALKKMKTGKSVRPSRPNDIPIEV